MDPITVLSLVAAACAVVTVAWGVRRSAKDRRSARGHYRNALYYAEDAKTALEDGTAAMERGRRDMARASARATEFAEEMRAAGSTFLDAAEEVDKIAAMNEPVPDSAPVSVEILTPSLTATWHEDGDLHYVQTTLWPSGGGIDVNSAINHAGQTLSLMWKEFDILVGHAQRLRTHDDEAPEPIVMVEIDENGVPRDAAQDDSLLPFADCPVKGCPTLHRDCPNCGQTEAARRAVWEEVANSPPAAPPEDFDPLPRDRWEDPDHND